jgi:hypothetical protein
MRPTLEVADIFRRHGETFRAAPPSRPAVPQRSAAMSSGADDCGMVRIAYNSCLMGKFRNGELTAVEKGRYGSAGAFFK